MTVQESILLRPNYVDGYSKLSVLEAEKLQFGKAEVALYLGLLLDPGNENLTEKLKSIRDQDPVLPDVSSKEGTLNPVRKMQADDLYEWAQEIDSKPELIRHIFLGNVDEVKAAWTPESAAHRSCHIVMTRARDRGSKGFIFDQEESY